MTWAQDVTTEIVGMFACYATTLDRRDETLSWRSPMSAAWLERDHPRTTERLRRRWSADRTSTGRRRRAQYVPQSTPTSGVCEGCGELFERPYSNGRPSRYCSTRCGRKIWRHENREKVRASRRYTNRRAEQRRVAANRARWAAEVLTCAHCTRAFHRAPSLAGTVPRHCSKRCRDVGYRRAVLGEPRVLEGACRGCAATFTTTCPSRQFCTKSCKDRTSSREWRERQAARKDVGR